MLRGRMIATAEKLFGNEKDGRDTLQQAFISAFRAIARINADATLSTWLHWIVTDTALTHLRPRRRQLECLIEDLLPRFEDAGQSTNLTRLDGATCIERTDVRVVKWCGVASIRCRKAIDRFCSWETPKISTLPRWPRCAQSSPNAIKIRVHRARLALKKLIEGERSAHE